MRSIRYAKEIEGISSIIANDMDSTAVESIERNIKHNGVEGFVKGNKGDACEVMYAHRNKNKFDIIDIDPYGSPSIFTDPAIQAVKHGGLLCVTATDLIVLCGNTPEVCYRKYGATPIKGKVCHETALRIVIHHIQHKASTYGKFVKPLLSLQMDFYLRVFLQVLDSPSLCQTLSSLLSPPFLTFLPFSCPTLFASPYP